jgi:O-antigen/teichoic acid export membrane protein
VDTVSAEGGRPRGVVRALGSAQILVSLSGFVVQMLLARYLGQQSYGSYGFVLGVLALFSFLADMNLRVLITREISREASQAGALLARSLLVLAPSSLMMTMLTLAYVAIQDPRWDVLVAATLAALAASATGVQVAAEGTFLGLRTMTPVVVATMVGRVVYVVLTVILLLWGCDLVGALAAQAAGPVVASIVLLLAFVRRYGWPRTPSWTESVGLARTAISFAANRFFDSVFLASDVLILKALWGDDEVGAYRAGTLLLLQLPLLGMVLSRGLYPRLSLLAQDRDTAGVVMGRGIRLLLLLSTPMAVGGLLLAEPIVLLLFGPDYAAATPVLAVVMPAVVLRYLGFLLSNALSAFNLQPLRTWSAMGAAVINVLANLVVVPRWGAVGAAWTTVGTEVLLVVAMGIMLRPAVGHTGVLPYLLRLTPPLLLLTAWCWWLASAPLWFLVPGGMLAFGGSAWITGALRGRDVLAVLRE